VANAVQFGAGTEAVGFGELMTVRRTQLRFRLGVAAAFIVPTIVLLNDLHILIWGAVYLSLQFAEVIAFRRQKIVSLCESKRRRALALTILATNVAVFASIALVELPKLGLWSVAYGEALVCCILFNVALTTQGSRYAFVASLAPALVYLGLFPILAWRLFGCPPRAATAIGAVGIGLVFGAYKLWFQTASAQDAERRARAALQRSAETANESRIFLDAILEYVPSILNVQDAETGAIVLVNRAMQIAAGRPRAELIGKTPLEFMDPDLAAVTTECNRQALRSGEPVKLGPYVAVLRQGRRLLRTTKIPVIGLDRPYVLSVSEDVTEDQALAEAKAAAAEALTQALARAEAANEAKSVFLATMSHEIRTPLNGVLGMVQAMAAGDLTPMQRERLGVVRQSGETLLAILNDVLDLSKIEAGRLELESIEFSLSAIAAGCQAAFANVASSKGLDFGFTIDDDAQGLYRGDPTRVRQILYNLLSNAMKFTQAGEVAVRLSRLENGLVICVKDSGLGMTAEQMERLFQKFAQADASTTRKFGGTGLGLAIVRHLAVAMGGDIAVGSALGEGTTFTVQLGLPWVGRDVEVDRDQAVDDAERDTADFEALRVLVAEDNEINQLVIKTLLSQAGVDAVVVGTGKLALEAWTNHRWDLILMDVQMPEMDGPTATRLIREREHQTGRARTPIVALTANVMTHQIADYMAAGMDDHVAKPIEASRLIGALEHALRPSETADVAQRGALR
jgi:PAS domain S-box-containing protein